jgi:ABC transporter substrate binding protein (PQQ-dependent alcohol dehydrogenase system)
MIDRLAAAALAAVLCLATADARPSVTAGYLWLKDDPRYVAGDAFAGIVVRDIGRPLPGARLGLQDARDVGRAVGTDFRLIEAGAPDAEALVQRARRMVREKGAAFLIADLPPEALLKVADALEDEPALLLNVSARADRLREEDCRRNVAHVVPSRRMLPDALAQGLAERGWTRLLVLQGPSPADAEAAEAMARAAARFGLEIVARRRFELTSDPRRRDQSNVALMTARPEADVIHVVDSQGEFARLVPYRTARPRPVTGDAGLSPVAWHWSWDRYGAPQVQHRFERLAPSRRMDGRRWAAWVAMKAVMQAALRSDSQDFAAMRAFLMDPALRLDGSKGAAMSFRPWNRQLRQPVLLAGPDAVADHAPLEPFLHRSNDLDTLGADAPESRCPRPEG